MRVDASNIHHIETCPGCPTCDCLMQFYSGCEVCGRTAHKEALVYHPADGTYTCSDCQEANPAPQPLAIYAHA